MTAIGPAGREPVEFDLPKVARQSERARQKPQNRVYASFTTSNDHQGVNGDYSLCANLGIPVR